jgi:hypothetical protein
VSDRLLVVLSDLEMGAGGPTDDCPHSAFIGERLLDYTSNGVPIDFIFNGDTFDFLKVDLDGRYPRHVTEPIALAKLSRIARAHEGFFAALRELIARGSGRHRLHFITGNHDFELFFISVQQRIRRLCGASERELAFPGLALDVGDVHIEHGSQGDALFRVNPARPFVEHQGQRILNLPWGSVSVIDLALPYHAELHTLDRIKPKQALFAALPEAKELLLARARDYWARGFWRGLLIERDPLKRVSWEMIKEVALRLLAADADVSCGRFYLDALRSDARHRIYVVAHEHQARSLQIGEKTLLQTGCLRNEYTLDPRTLELQPCDKSIAEVHLVDDRAVDARMVQVATPSEQPIDLFTLRPILMRLLAEYASKAQAA